MSKTKKPVVVIIVAIIAGLILMAGVLAWQALAGSQAEPDPFLQATSQQDEVNQAEAVNLEAQQTEQPQQEREPTVDPETVSTIDIEPMGIAVSYVRGIPGFEFVVKRTATGTQYVQFLSPDLAGETCTDDEGAFAAIIKNPASEEDRTTVTDSVTIDGEEYGLSLDGKNCASDKELFTEYQASFSDAFSLLRVIQPETDS